jgi:hypothetical protein
MSMVEGDLCLTVWRKGVVPTPLEGGRLYLMYRFEWIGLGVVESMILVVGKVAMVEGTDVVEEVVRTCLRRRRCRPLIVRTWFRGKSGDDVVFTNTSVVEYARNLPSALGNHEEPAQKSRQ